MRFITVPNLPDGKVRLAVVDGRISERAESRLLELGIDMLRMPPYKGLCEPISCHPDLVIHHVGNERIVYAPGTSDKLIEELARRGFTLIEGKTCLSAEYPGDIAYNVARVGKYAFHNLKYTDPVLMEELDRAGVELVHVRQGYTKCSVSIVDEYSVITSDIGIKRAAEAKGLETLWLESDSGILLPGFDRGFIGGCSGLVDRNTWAITGEIASLKAAQEITAFLEARGVSAISLDEGRPVDVGSIIPLLVE